MKVTQLTGHAPQAAALGPELAALGPCLGCTGCRGLCPALIQMLSLPRAVLRDGAR